MKKVTLTLTLLLLVTAVFTLSACAKPELIGTELNEPFPAPDFTLVHADGSPISLSDYEGKVVYLYFGYTFCPDVCPSTLLDLKQMMQTIGNDAEDVQVIMVTVDPERDTAEVVAEYVAYFHPDFVGLSGTPEEIKAVADSYGIYYQAHEGTAASGYLIDHTASVIAIDKAGNYRATYSFGTTPDEFVTDLEKVLLKE